MKIPCHLVKMMEKYINMVVLHKSKSFDFEITTANSVAKALDIIEFKSFDAIISDYQMVKILLMGSIFFPAVRVQ